MGCLIRVGSVATVSSVTSLSSVDFSLAKMYNQEREEKSWKDLHTIN